MAKRKSIQYQIRIGNQWEDVNHGTTAGMAPDWLRWHDHDGSIGISAPGKWRVKPAGIKAKRADF